MKYSFAYQIIKRKDLENSLLALLIEADKATQNAYAPYSNFRVGAALLKKDGSIVTGSNKENAAYPAGLCAERAALAQLNFETDKVVAIAISYCSNDKLLNTPLSPCGICRQSIAEVEDHQKAAIKVIMGSPGDEVLVVSDAKHLLPFAFGQSALPEE